MRISAPVAGKRGTRPGLLVWGHCSLDKHGSFEDYLLRLSERATATGWRVRIVAEASSASMRAELTARGATLLAVAPRRSASLCALAREALTEPPDVVHFHFGSPTTTRAPLLKMLTAGRSYVVVSDHGSRQRLLPQPKGALASAKAWRRKMAARSVSLYLPVSSFVAERLNMEVGPDPAHVHVLHNGVDLARFSPPSEERRRSMRKVLGLPADGFVVAFVGTLCPEKGVPELLDAQEALLTARPDAAVLWVGDGPLASKVAASCARRRIVYVGRRDDVDDMLAAADAIAVPSRWEEAFSLVLAEAAASGIASVASRIGGIPEVVDDGRTGLLVEPGDARALGQALLAMADDVPGRVAMGRAARTRAERLFGLDRMIDGTLAHYAGLSPKGRNGWKID